MTPFRFCLRTEKSPLSRSYRKWTPFFVIGILLAYSGLAPARAGTEIARTETAGTSEGSPNGLVIGFVNNHEFEFRFAIGGRSFRIGDRIAIVSKETGYVVGYGVVARGCALLATTGCAYAHFSTYTAGGVPVAGDEVRFIDLRKDAVERPRLPGRADLLIADGAQYSPRYKPLYLESAQIGKTAATLSQGEFLIDLTSYVAFGITDETNVSTALFALPFGIINASVEQRVFRIDEFTGKVEGSYLRTPDRVAGKTPKAAYDEVSGTAYLDIQSNSKLISHTRFTYAHRYRRRSEDPSLITAVLGNSTSLQSGQEYVFDNWDRFIFGPSYNFDLKTVGGYLGYLFIWDHLNIGVYLRTENFADFRLSTEKAYSPGIDAFYRF